MSDVRYSVMVLPRRGDGKILLQSWANEEGTITDGFGSFYLANEDPEKVAQAVLGDFGIKAQPVKVAQLQYYMNKPTGLVDLKITIYFADITEVPPIQETMHWFAPSDVPYLQMHPATRKWLPILLNGDVPLVATIKIDQPGDHTKGIVTEFTIEN